MKLVNQFATALVAVSASAFAQTQPAAAQGATAEPAAPMADGKVRKVDKDAGKVTLRHGPIQNLDLPAMTMVFKVSDPKMLDSLKEGDKVRFSADKVSGVITVTRIEAAK